MDWLLYDNGHRHERANALELFWCLQFEKVADWERFEATVSVNISVQSVTTCMV